MFSLRTDIGKQTITFFATNNNNPIFTTNINVNTATYSFFYSQKLKDKLGLEKPTSLPVLEERRTLSFLDKLTFSVTIESRKQTTENKRSKRNSSGIQLYSSIC